MAVSPIYGTVGEYQPEIELFSSYIERVQLFFLANTIADDKKVPVFFSLLGSKTYSLLRSLVAPTLPQDKSLGDLVTTLKKHFEPKPLVIAEQFRLHQRSQNIGETVTEYVAELRRLATHCQYGVLLEEALRDRLMCGIRNVRTQKKLLVIEDLTLTKAIAISQGEEAADKNVESLKGKETTVNTVSSAPNTGMSPCYRGGNP